VSKRPAGKVCKKTPEGEEEFQGSGDDFQASEVPSTQSSSSSCLPTAAGLSQSTGKGKGREDQNRQQLLSQFALFKVELSVEVICFDSPTTWRPYQASSLAISMAMVCDVFEFWGSVG
jgi:hypothetical protein